tara:strand:- start:932 stop:1129 length:198 start_codon:yes stop_codon:yes gene_type:complete
MEWKDTEEGQILSEIIAQLVDEDTNNNDLAFLSSGGDLPILTEEQKRKSMISKKYNDQFYYKNMD